MVESCAGVLTAPSDGFHLPAMLVTLIPIIKGLYIPSVYIIGDGE